MPKEISSDRRSPDTLLGCGSPTGHRAGGRFVSRRERACAGRVSRRHETRTRHLATQGGQGYGVTLYGASLANRYEGGQRGLAWLWCSAKDSRCDERYVEEVRPGLTVLEPVGDNAEG
jgi:hypothetical protein